MPACLRRRRLTSAALLACAASALHAEPAPPLALLLRQAAASPRLAESAAEVDRARGLAAQAGVRPNPTIGVFTENIAGSRPYRSFDQAQTTLQYNQPFETGGKRRTRIAAGEAGIAAAQVRNVEARILFAQDLARAYAAAEIAEGRIALAEDEVAEATADLLAARTLVAAGKEARLRALQAESAVDAVTADLQNARAARIAAFSRLSALAGTDRRFDSLSERLLDQAMPVPPAIDPRATPAYRAALAERAAAERRIAAERARAAPDITASLGVRRLEFENATAVVGGVSVPLAIFDRNRGNIDAAQADLRTAEARVALALHDAQAEAEAAPVLLAATEARVAAAAGILRTADETYRLAHIAYESGKAPLLELLAARHGLGVARGIGLDARIARFEARIALARLAGRTFSGDPVQ